MEAVAAWPSANRPDRSRTLAELGRGLDLVRLRPVLHDGIVRGPSHAHKMSGELASRCER